ncbi:MAG TPA: VIT1/CCC1 family protein [Candidatus Paceibacterota bacterium]|nr:VIT1/CCC1 family protein [Candidatus Paceibacterota bacterium]
MDATPKTYKNRAQNELTEHIVYGRLAARERNPENKALLERLSAQEKSHYEFWQSLVPNEKITPRIIGLISVPFLRAIFGITFVTKFLETHEKDSIAAYQSMLATIPNDHRHRLEEIIKDEQSHEQGLIGQLKEKRIAYIGFIALGLSDAIVEITGVHSGFLGVTGKTLIAGISGIIVGFAAAISMGSAAYIQAKQDPNTSPIPSALATGFSYLASVILLALPYFLIRDMLTAFMLSTSVGVLLLAAFVFFSTVIADRPFLREFGESVGLMLVTAIATYILGTVVGSVFHVNQGNF